MRKRNLIFPLVVSSSLFIPSVEPLERTTDFNSLDNENIYEAVDILIAEGGGGGGAGGGGGQKPGDKEATQKKRQRAQDAAKKRNKAKGIQLEIMGGDPITRDPSFPSKFKLVNKNQLNTIKNKTDSMMEEIWEPYKRIADENKRRKESGNYSPLLELFGISPRSLNFTTAGLDSQKDGNEARAETYHKLAIKSLESSLNKNEIDPTEEHHHHRLLAFNYYHVEDFENSNKSLRKAASGYKRPKEKALTKTLIVTTEILSGNVNQGCQDLYDYFLDGDITFDSTFPIEDFCIFDEEKL